MYDNFHLIYYNLLLLAVLIECCFKYSIYNTFYISTNEKGEKLGPIILIVILSIILGYRPGSVSFGDTSLYQYVYENRLYIYETEPVFNVFSKICSSLGVSTGIYLSIIAFLYILLPYLFISKHTYSKWFSLLMILTSFSFLGYGVNGIRNGLALSLLTYSFVFINLDGKAQHIKLIICCLLAIGIHKSSMLPVCGIFLSIYIIKDVKSAILIWVLSIPISFIGGNSISPLFLNLGFDDRLDSYLTGIFKTGFRWDFILYSSVPIFFAYYIIYIRNIVVDRLYMILINTYTLSNAVWIIIINAAFSNRFAYLSWFLYPIVIAYPLLKYQIWDDDGNTIALVLFIYYLFTYLMSML